MDKERLSIKIETIRDFYLDLEDRKGRRELNAKMYVKELKNINGNMIEVINPVTNKTEVKEINNLQAEYKKLPKRIQEGVVRGENGETTPNYKPDPAFKKLELAAQKNIKNALLNAADRWEKEEMSKVR